MEKNGVSATGASIKKNSNNLQTNIIKNQKNITTIIQPIYRRKSSIKNSPKMSEAQKRALLNLSRRRNISTDELDRMVEETFHSSFDNLSSHEASQFIRQLQSAA